jgi:hypothetical protein
MANYDAQYFANLFARIGVSSDKIPYLLAQVAHETGNFNLSASKQLRDHNNASGIVWSNTVNQKKYATKSDSEIPETINNGSEGNHYFYAQYDSLDNWAKDYIRILNNHGNALQAISIEDFLNRLYNNGVKSYFSSTYDSYSAAVNKWYNKYKSIKPNNILNAVLVIALLGALAYIIAR